MQTAPPPPPAFVEIFNPVERSHRIDARCLGITSAIAWRFDGARASITALRFRNQRASPTQIETINRRLRAFRGDFDVYLECNRDVAAVTIREMAPYGRDPIKAFRFEWSAGRVQNDALWGSPDGQ